MRTPRARSPAGRPSGRLHAGTGRGEAVDHAVLRRRGIDGLGGKLAELRERGLVRSSGRGRNRRHALTAEGLRAGEG